MASFARAPFLCTAFFAIAPLLCALAQNEIKMTLYIDEVWGTRPTQSDVKVVQGYNNTSFGEMWVHDWPVRDRPDPSAEVIARGQGYQILSGLDPRRWYMSMNLVFNDKSRYGGSTLQIIGSVHGPEREWSIAGGTGAFTMARGVAKYTFETTSGDSVLYKVNVHTYHSSMEFIAVCPKCDCNSKITEPIAHKAIA